MSKCYRFIFLVLTCCLMFASAGYDLAQGQTIEATVLITDECAGNDAVLTVDMNVWGEISEPVVGWVIVRQVVGKCVPDVQLGGVRPFVPGENQYVVVDTPPESGYSCLYRAWALDEDFNKYFIYWPQRTDWAYYDCQGTPAGRGQIVESVVPTIPPMATLDVCDDECWVELNPWQPHLPDNVDLGFVGLCTEVYGELMKGMDGPYINNPEATWFTESALCGPVPNERQNWGSVKAIFR